MSIIKLKNVSKFYYSKGVIASGFTKLNLDFNMGEFVAITGESGSGKSTLLNVISGLDTYEEGEMYINGEETSHYTEKDFEEYRRRYIGNIFQNFNLVNSYTVYQNIELVLLLNGAKKKDVKEKVLDLIRTVDLYKFRNTKVSKLSGGQKQRVAIARALAKDTPIIIADEPTGNLDSRSAESIIKLLSEIAKDKLVIIVTHNYDQVEPYVTRKIKMNDGKVLEDKQIKKTKEVKNETTNNYKDISLFNKFRLGVRNTFNIVPKFLLVLAVYLFITLALVSEYAAFKKNEYDVNTGGENYFFNDLSDKRIIFKKKDGTQFTEEEYEKISKLDNVEKLFKNDLLLDLEMSITDDSEMWISGLLRSLDDAPKDLDLGSFPKEENEIILYGSREYWIFDYYAEEMIGKTIYFYDINSWNYDKTKPYVISGVKYKEDSSMFGDIYTISIFVNNERINDFSSQINAQYGNIEVKFLDKIHAINTWDTYYKIVPNKSVPKGQALISEDFKWSCPNANCYNSLINVKVKSLYYEENLTLRPTMYYNRDNFAKKTGYSKDDYNYYNGQIYINIDDYNSLYDKIYYQSSIYVKDVDKLEITNKELQDLGLTTLTMREVKYNSDTLAAIQLIKTSVTIVLVIALFFICYFVIKLILKSRNTYFATIRMLGATKTISRHLVIIELFTIANLSYLVLLILVFLNAKGVYNIEFINTIMRFLKLGDYILLYVILTMMSLLVSEKFSKSIFKKSAMSTIREGE